MRISPLKQQSFKDPTAGLVLRQKQGEAIGRTGDKRNHSVSRLLSATLLIFFNNNRAGVKVFQDNVEEVIGMEYALEGCCLFQPRDY